MALQWDVRELLRATGEGLPAVTELVPFNASSEAMFRDSGANCFAKLAPKRKARGGIPMPGQIGVTLEPHEMQINVMLHWGIAQALRTMPRPERLPRSMEERDAQVKARRLAARRDAVNEELRAA